MVNEYERLKLFIATIRDKTDFVPKVALILGSGLGNFAEKLNKEAIVNYSEIPGFPISTAPGHIGRFIFANIQGVPTVIMQGRIHYYEGYDMQDVVAPIRLLKMLGVRILFLTNAAGSINLEYNVGDFMLIKDHISSLVPSALRGLNIAELGERFSDMTHIYDPALRKIIKQTASDINIVIREGVYIQTAGPNFETPAEIAMYRNWGADAVGMSTACEAMVATHMSMRVCALSCISNLGAGISGEKLTAEEVSKTTSKIANQFETIISQSIAKFIDL